MPNLPINKLEQLLEHVEQATASLHLPSFLLLSFLEVDDFPQLSDELVQYIHIHDAQQDEERSADRGPDYTADGAVGVKLGGYGCSGRGDDDGGYDDNPARGGQR